jgi:hypothetical protein
MYTEYIPDPDLQKIGKCDFSADQGLVCPSSNDGIVKPVSIMTMNDHISFIIQKQRNILNQQFTFSCGIHGS